MAKSYLRGHVTIFKVKISSITSRGSFNVKTDIVALRGS